MRLITTTSDGVDSADRVARIELTGGKSHAMKASVKPATPHDFSSNAGGDRASASLAATGGPIHDAKHRTGSNRDRPRRDRRQAEPEVFHE
jgi:hypothetical protein